VGAVLSIIDGRVGDVVYYLSLIRLAQSEGPEHRVDVCTLYTNLYRSVHLGSCTD
jgi:hypothetical protein